MTEIDYSALPVGAAKPVSAPAPAPHKPPKTASKKRADSTSSDGDGAVSSKKPRFAWTLDIHQQFIAAIFDVGLTHATPKAVSAMFAPDKKVPSIDSIRSHMQDLRDSRFADENPMRMKFKVRSTKFLTAPTAPPANTTPAEADLPLVKVKSASASNSKVLGFPKTGVELGNASPKSISGALSEDDSGTHEGEFSDSISMESTEPFNDFAWDTNGEEVLAFLMDLVE